MVGLRRTLGLWVAFLPVLSPAMSKIHVEGAQVGQRVLEITIDDSILTPDLSKLKIEGYEIEEAVFVDQTPFEFNPLYLDLTAPGNGKVVEFLPTPGILVIDLPAAFIPNAGHIFGDTAFGGLLRKVIKVESAPQPGQFGQRWTLATVEAGLTEAILSGELNFSTRLDLNQAFGDIDRAEEVLGYLPDGSSQYVDAEYALREALVLFQPLVAGRLRVAGGKVEDFAVTVQGDCEVTAEARGVFHGRGEFQYEDELPARAPRILPLGQGLFLRVQNRPFLRMEAEIAGEGFAAQADFRVRNSIRSEIAYSRGQWRPLAENKMTHASKAVQELWGQGSLKLSIKPRMEFLLAGMHGPAISFNPYARFTSTADAKSWIWKSEEARLAGAGRNTFKDAMLLSHGNKELSLGTDIFMEARTTFSGPAATRNFLLFSREQSVLSPPREGSLTLKEADSGRINLTAVTFPKADRFIIQHKIGNGPWETFGEQAAIARIRLGNLKPSTAYRFRAIGVNAMGAGPAFPPEGIAFTTPVPNLHPFHPFALFPDSGAVVADGNPALSWRGGDPDPGNKVLYSVLLDTRNPPVATRASGLADTALLLSDLKPGTTYFWRVVSTDGKLTAESPVRAFTVRAPSAELKAPPTEGSGNRVSAGYPMVALPRGTFLREDGRTVTVGPFLIGKYEVSQGEYERVAGRNPSYRLQDSLPVERVTWEEAESYCREIGGRLPTEAEWEYAARAGTTEPYYWGSGNPSEYAWFRENSQDRTQKVGLLKPNAWGLHDVAGNVFEWVQDWYGDYPATVDHPKGAAAGTAKVIRGASWYSEGGNLGLGARYNNRPAFRNFKVGFRCAKDGEAAPGAASARHPASRLVGSAGPSDRIEAASGSTGTSVPIAVQAAAAPATPPVEPGIRPAGPLPVTSPVPR